MFPDQCPTVIQITINSFNFRYDELQKWNFNPTKVHNFFVIIIVIPVANKNNWAENINMINYYVNTSWNKKINTNNEITLASSLSNKYYDPHLW